MVHLILRLIAFKSTCSATLRDELYKASEGASWLVFFSVGFYQSLGQDRCKHAYDTAGEMSRKEGRIGITSNLIINLIINYETVKIICLCLIKKKRPRKQ